MFLYLYFGLPDRGESSSGLDIKSLGLGVNEAGGVRSRDGDQKTVPVEN